MKDQGKERKERDKKDGKVYEKIARSYYDDKKQAQKILYPAHLDLHCERDADAFLNLNRLQSIAADVPLLPDMPGITSIFMYLSSPLSYFTWHIEDLGLCSISRHDVGDPKVWYFVPPSQFEAFRDYLEKEKCLQETQIHPLYAYSKLPFFLPTPQEAKRFNITRIIQREGDLVVTARGAYHSGFNMGYSANSAVNGILPCELMATKHSAEGYLQALKDRLRDSSPTPGVKRKFKECVYLIERSQEILDGLNNIWSEADLEKASKGKGTKRKRNSQKATTIGAGQKRLKSLSKPLLKVASKAKKGNPRAKVRTT